MTRARLVALLVLLALLGSLFVAYALIQLDPLRQVVTFTDHGVQFHGGRVDGALLRFIQRGPEPGNATLGWVLARSSYSTLSYVRDDFKLPSYAPPLLANPFEGALVGSPPDIVGAIRGGISWLLSLVLGDARAACGAGGGTCFRIGTGGNWNASNSWSATSGGASCGVSCVPATTDAVVLDGGGSGTVTLVAATTVASIKWTSTTVILDTSAANSWALTVGSTSTAASTLVVDMGAGQLLLNASTMNVYGEWGSSAGPSFGSLTAGTSTIIFKSSANQLSNSFGSGVPKNVTFDSSATGSTAITYTLGLYGCVSNCSLNMSGALLITNTGGGTGTTTLNTSASNIAIGLTSTPSSITIATLGFLSDNASSVTVAGTWSNSGVHTYGTSTVTFSANGNANGQFANMTINASVTVTASAGVAWFGILTINGAFNPNAQDNQIRGPAAGTTNPIVFGGSGTYGSASYSLLGLAPIAGTLWHLPSATYQTTEIQFFPLVAVAGDGFEFRADGNISAYQLTFRAQATNEPMFFNSQTFNITLTNVIFTLETASTSALEGIKATSGTWTIGGLVVNKTTSVNFYIAFGSTTWNVTSAAGYWDNTGTTFSSRWDPGTSTVNLTCNAPSATLKFAGSHLGVAEFATLNVQTNQNAGCASTMATNDLIVSGALSVQSTAPGPIAYITLDTSASNLGVTAGSVTLGTWGQINAESSTITVSGNWNMNNANASFTFGFSTVVFSTTTTISIGSSSALPNRSFYNLDIAATGTTTTIGGVAGPLMIIANVLTLGTGTVTGTSSTLYIASASTTPFVNPGATIVSTLDFDKSGGSFTMPTTTVTGACAFIGGTSNYTVTLGGALSCTGNLGVAYYGVSGLVTLDASASNFTLTASTLLLGTAAGTATQAGAFLARGSSPTLAGLLTYTAGSYVDLGSSSWTITGAGSNTWNNISTSASWSAGTSTVTFRGSSGGTITPTGNNIAVPEMNVVVFDSSVSAGVTWIMGGSKGLVVAGSMTVQNTASSPSGNTLFDTNAGNPLTIGSMTVSSNAALNMRSSTITVNGNWTYQGAAAGVGTSTVIFAANSTFIGRNVAFSADFYDVTINAGVTVTRNSTLMFMSDALVANGTLVWTGTNPSAPAMNVYVNGASGTANPLVIGPSGDLSRIGLFVYFITPASTFSYNIAAGLYSQVAFEGGSNTVSVTANFLGNVTTNPAFCVIDDTADTCSVRIVTAFNQGDSNAINHMTVNLNGFTLDAAGWIGMDATLNVGTGKVMARNGFGMEFATSIVNLGSGTLTTYVSDFRQAAGYPDGLYMEHGAIINAGSGTLNIHGQLFLYTAPVDTIAGAPANAGIISGTATINVYSDSGTPAAHGSPGQVWIGTSTHWYIDFGSSTWNIQGNWLNQSTNSAWSASGGTVNFTGAGTITPAPTGITLPEFPTVAFASSAGYTLLANSSLTFDALAITGTLNILGVQAGGGGVTLTLTASSGAYASLNSWTTYSPSVPLIVFPITLSDPNATLSINALLFGTQVSVYKDGTFVANAVSATNGGQSMSVGGPWSTHLIKITGRSSIPGGGTPPPNSENFSCSYSYAILSVTLICTSNITVTDPANITWLVDSQVVGTGTTLRTSVIVLGVSRTLTVEMVINDVLSYVDSTGSVEVQTTENIIVYAALVFVVAVAIIGVASHKAKKSRARRAAAMRARNGGARRTVVVYNGRLPPPSNGRS